MDYDAQLKLQAFLDGELPEGEASEVASGWPGTVRRRPCWRSCATRARPWRGSKTGIQLPESREFFWSKVEREIQRLETPAPEPARTPFFALLRRFLVPASALALVFTATVMLIRPAGPSGRTAAAEIETALADSGAFTYRDYSAGTTLVWLSYPADNEDAEGDENRHLRIINESEVGSDNWYWMVWDCAGAAGGRPDWHAGSGNEAPGLLALGHG